MGRSRRRRAVDPAPFEADVADLASDGRGVARIDGKVVFIDGALPGERVRARRLASRASADDATVVEVLRASADRVTPRCAHFGVCGGCVLQHLAPEAQRGFKQKQLLDAFARIGGVQPETVVAPLAGPVWGYRRRARLGAKHVPKKGRTLVGFRERHAPFLADIERCLVLDPRVGERLQALSALLDGLSLKCAIPQIEVAACDRVALVLRVLETPTDADCARLAAFAAEQDCDIWLQPGGPASIRPLAGGGAPAALPAFSPDGSGLRLRLLPTDFIQVNGETSQAMVRQALAWLAPLSGARLIELFAGLGNFTAPLAAAGAQVTAVEGEAGLVARGRANTEAAGLAVDWQQADLYTGTAGQPWAAQAFDAALIDPPRAGAREVLAPLVATGVQRIVYVSCHPATLARDAAILVAEHGFRLQRAGVCDMFPHTAHIESMALFVREGASPHAGAAGEAAAGSGAVGKDAVDNGAADGD